jgi:6-phosphogluconolactonase (cycloisomerase 2 family)
MTQASIGMTPFGFAFTRRSQLIVSEAFGGADGASAVSSYQLGSSGLVDVSASVKDHQGAACWIVLARNDSLAFTSNTGSGSISAYRVGESGRLSLVAADGRSGVTGDGTKPTDMATSDDDRFLYAVDSAAAKLSIFGIHGDGALVNVADVPGLPPTITGLAAE